MLLFDLLNWFLVSFIDVGLFVLISERINETFSESRSMFVYSVLETCIERGQFPHCFHPLKIKSFQNRLVHLCRNSQTTIISNRFQKVSLHFRTF